jgi:hypothetical protein
MLDDLLLILDLYLEVGLDAAEPVEYLCAIGVLPPDILDLFGGGTTASQPTIVCTGDVSADAAVSGQVVVGRRELLAGSGSSMRRRRSRPRDLPALIIVAIGHVTAPAPELSARVTLRRSIAEELWLAGVLDDAEWLAVIDDEGCGQAAA